MIYFIFRYFFVTQNKILLIITVRANFEFISKLGVDFWCFHDRDIAPDGKTLEVSQYLSFFT